MTGGAGDDEAGLPVEVVARIDLGAM